MICNYSIYGFWWELCDFLLSYLVLPYLNLATLGGGWFSSVSQSFEWIISVCTCDRKLKFCFSLNDLLQMTKADFIRNNRGIDDGKDLPEEYLGALYDHIVKNEIKMKAENSQPQSKQVNGFNRLLGLDGILNLVMGKQPEEKPLSANDLLIKNIQEQFKAKSGKSE